GKATLTSLGPELGSGSEGQGSPFRVMSEVPGGNRPGKFGSPGSTHCQPGCQDELMPIRNGPARRRTGESAEDVVELGDHKRERLLRVEQNGPTGRQTRRLEEFSHRRGVGNEQ